MIAVRQLELGPMANYVYLVADPAEKECAVVDPAWDVPAILRAVEEEGWRLRAAIATHNHFDHVNGVAGLLKAADIPVYVNKLDAAALKDAGGNLRPAAGGDTVRVGGLEIELLHTPGHTEGSQCLLAAGRLVSGDTLFIGGCGRVDLPTSDPERMYASLKKLAALPDSTVLLPGHNYSEAPSRSLGAEKADNPYLRSCATRPLGEFLKLIGG